MHSTLWSMTAQRPASVRNQPASGSPSSDRRVSTSTDRRQDRLSQVDQPQEEPHGQLRANLVRPPEAKPNPADPLSNPPTFPEVTPHDMPVLLPNEPPEEPKDAPRPGCPPTQPDHPLGPHDVIE